MNYKWREEIILFQNINYGLAKNKNKKKDLNKKNNYKTKNILAFLWDFTVQRRTENTQHT